MIDPLAWIDEESRAWTEKGLRRSLAHSEAIDRVTLVRSGVALINFASNDYLGLAGDPRLRAAAEAVAARFGWGSGASPLVSGWTEEHQKLAEALAEFEGAEAVALFPTGYAANLGAIGALVGKEDAVYLDRLNHACLIDGAKLSGAALRVYPHNDADRLASILARDRGRYRRSLIATDGVFSMDGDLGPIDRLADLADEFGTMLLVDEAHGTGVFGPDGRGAASELGVAGRVHIRVGTLSKALGSLGGFVSGSRRLVDWMINHARPLVFSTSLPPAAVAATRAALAIVQAEPWRRERVRDAGRFVSDALRSLGYDVPEVNGPIIPVMIGEPGAALAVSESLRASGLLVPAIRPPTVPTGTARLRISLSAAHSDEDIRRLLDGFAIVSSPRRA